jgi:hypothetical protein
MDIRLFLPTLLWLLKDSDSFRCVIEQNTDYRKLQYSTSITETAVAQSA